MENCTKSAPSPAKACSGKCKNGGCASASTVWVLAACDGATAIYEKCRDGSIIPVTENGSNLYSSTAGFCNNIQSYSEQGKFQQLILVGSNRDILNTQSSLPANISGKVIAEIVYPLTSDYFAATNSKKLSQELNNIFAS